MELIISRCLFISLDKTEYNKTYITRIIQYLLDSNHLVVRATKWLDYYLLQYC